METHPYNMGSWYSPPLIKDEHQHNTVNDVLSAAYYDYASVEYFHQIGMLGFHETTALVDPVLFTDMFPEIGCVDQAPPLISGDVLWNPVSETETWTAKNKGFDAQEQQHQIPPHSTVVDDRTGEEIITIKNRKKSSAAGKCRRSRRSDNGVRDNINHTKSPSKEAISQYFNMPIMKAARELNVELTQLRKWCRQLGIRRWPHRKLMSLQTLINNVQELGEEGGGRQAVEALEEEKKLMEAMPDTEMESKTRRLRQVCFNAIYKKKKHMVMDSCPADSSGSCQRNPEPVWAGDVYSGSTRTREVAHQFGDCLNGVLDRVLQL